MTDLVSIVVPIYNMEKYLGTCVDSLIHQTYDNMEIILVNDGSKDMSGKICDEYAQQDSRIKVIHKENGGLSDARNKGMSIATGKYITFVDSDDFLHSRFVEILVGLSIEKDADIVVGDFSVYQNDTMWKDKIIVEEDISKAQVLNEKHLYDEKFIHTETVRLTIACAKIYRRELFDGIEYPVGKIHEDTFTTYKLMEKANRVVYVKEPLYYWRENFNSITRGKFTSAHLMGLDAFHEQLDYFINAGKQRYVEIVYDAYRDWFFWSYNCMRDAGMDYQKELKPYYLIMRKYVKYIKLTKSVGLKRWLKYRYLVFYKIPKLL